MKKLLIFAALLCLLAAAGCKKPHNPNIVDPAMSKEIYAKDKAYCKQWADQQFPSDKELGDRVDDNPIQAGEFDFGERRSSYDFYKQCMENRGWEGI